MPPTSTGSYRSWLKSNTGMKLSSDAAVQRLLYEGINNFESLNDFDKKSIERLQTICKEGIDAITEDQQMV